MLLQHANLPAIIMQQQRMGITAWPASKAVGIQGTSCRSCQDGLQVLCQLLHCNDVTGHLAENIDQLALLSKQVGAEHCTPRPPAVYASMLAQKCCLVGRARRERHNTGKGTCTQSLVIEQRLYKRQTNMTCHLLWPVPTTDLQVQELTQTSLGRAAQSGRVVHDLPGMFLM